MKYTDPFGLSPEDGGNKGGNFWHSLLGFIGIIPGPIGAVANAVDAGIYLSEGNYAMAAMCALDAVIPAAGAVGKALAGTCKYARIGREIATGAKVANTVFNLSRGMYNADRAVGSFCERHKDDLFTDKFRWTKADTADLASFGLSSLTCFISGKSLAKDLDDFMAASTDLATLGSSVGCFVAGTIVKTEEGDKNIEEIKAGDKVLSYEATTGRFAYKEVVDVIAHDGVTELAHVTVGGETIDSTTNHPYFVVGYGYVDAGNLIEGDTVLLANGEEGKVEKVEIEFLTEPVTVYNFEVKDWHCYFVGEAGVLVHNDSCVSTSGAGNTGGNTNGNSGEGGSSFGSYTFKDGIDVDLRGKGTVDDALKEAFKRVSEPRENYIVTKWAEIKNIYGKSVPVEWTSQVTGAQINIDAAHYNNIDAPQIPHVGYKTGGKRKSGGKIVGHIFVDEVTYFRPQNK